MNPFLTKSKKSDDRHKHCRRSYLSVDVGGDTQSFLELEPIWSKDRGLVSYNINNPEGGKSWVPDLVLSTNAKITTTYDFFITFLRNKLHILVSRMNLRQI